MADIYDKEPAVTEEDVLVELMQNNIVISTDFFQKAAKRKHTQVLNTIITMVETKASTVQHLEAKQSLEKFVRIVFYLAAEYGHVDQVERIIKIYPEKAADMVRSNNFEAFWRAAKNNHIQVMEKLIEITPIEKVFLERAYECATDNGHIEIMQKLIELNKRLDIFDQALLCDYYPLENIVFARAARNNRPDVIDKLITDATPERVKKLVRYNNYYAFHQAAIYENLGIMEKLMGLVSGNMLKKMLSSQASYEEYFVHYPAFQFAATLEDINFLKTIISIGQETFWMLESNEYLVIRNAAAQGRLDVIHEIIEQSGCRYGSLSMLHMVKAKNFEAFRNAAANGHVDVIDQLFNYEIRLKSAMVRANNFEAFRNAAANGHLNVIDKLIENAHTKVSAMVRANNFEAFQKAVINGHLNVSKKLLYYPEVLGFAVAQEGNQYNQLIQDFTISQMASLNKIMEVFHTAHPNDGFDISDKEKAKLYFYIMKHLIRQKTPESLQQINLLLSIPSVKALAHSQSNKLFSFAAANGNLDVIDKLIDIAPKKVSAMVSANNFEAFRNAAANDHVNVIEKLITIAPKKVSAMVRADNFEAFRNAAFRGHANVIDKLISLCQNETQPNISNKGLFTLTLAAYNAFIDAIKNFFTPPPIKIMDMVNAQHFEGFRTAVRANHFEVSKKLLCYPKVFDYAYTIGDNKYNEHIQNFTNSQITDLNQKIEAFRTTSPNDVFDITDSDHLKLMFYMMRHLIRQQTPESLVQLDLLLSIPSVQALAHHQSNELLRLALSLNNQEGAVKLLNISAVRELAEANNFHIQEQRSGLDLRVLARNRESSMTALTQDEEKTLERAQAKYQTTIQAQGVSVIMNELKDLLAQRYNAKPATVETGDGRVIPLPLDYNQFQELAKTLSADTRERALKSYYQHQDHTALRYLSIPNKWMSPNAKYVSRNGFGAWSTFDEYQPLISLLYLAAKDESTPAVNGYTIETRLENFIKELAYIGRAHNWDRSRTNPDTRKSEEFDDLEGDNPSCYSGVKKRLFQSVQGHPLLTLLTKDIIIQEVRDAVREHFINSINDKNCAELHTAWQAIINGEEADTSILSQLNLSGPQIQTIQDNLLIKYGQQFTVNLSNYLSQALTVQKPLKNLAEQYGGLVDLIQILEKKVDTLEKKEPEEKEFPDENPDREKVRTARLNYFQNSAHKPTENLKPKEKIQESKQTEKLPDENSLRKELREARLKYLDKPQENTGEDSASPNKKF